MTASRVVGGIGRTIVVAGAVVLLFVAYQLWGTGIQHSLAQSELEDDFEDNLEVAVTEEMEAEAQTVAAPDEEDADDEAEEAVAAESSAGETAFLVDSITADAADVAEEGDLAYGAEVVDLLPLLYPGQGEAAARITIPAIGVDEIIVAGIGVDDLRKGPGLYDFAPLPGQPGNAAIAGHRTTYGAPFHRLDELQPDDEIIVQTLQGTFTYRVFAHDGEDGQVGHFIVPPTAVEVLDDHGDNRITLTACHPKYSSRQRIIVQAGLVGEPKIRLPKPGQVSAEGDDPAEAEVQLASEADLDDEPPGGISEGENASTQLESDGFGEGLGGDQSAIVPAVMWALAATAIWLTAWLIGTRWKRWPAYVLATLPFLIVLFMSFMRVDEALPAY